ncbi:hypothetical protein [Hufsiella ginkgonis]|uniref:Uncharacterized protein n=1 Tax=Hufsiella ginkgonis TaxID=2695274 RepID=A0A7K1Y1U4_9SPHI|nr:hypothetical protein [Hufsiella ginkgonis]MXV17162.1 hypothetical protein [Hufsiella ginkgonis]
MKNITMGTPANRHWYNLAFTFPGITLMVCLASGIFNYLLDCIFNFTYAITQPLYILIYTMDFLVFRIWIFLPFIAGYFFLFRKKPALSLLALKLLYSLAVCMLMRNYFFKDDWSLYNGEYSKLKSVLTYVFFGISFVLAYEFFSKANQPAYGDRTE